MSTGTGTSLQLSRVIKAPRARVFRAWTDPTDIARWGCPDGGAVVRAENDVVVGGRYLIHMRMADGVEYRAIGRYLEVDPPRRLVYTWDWEGEGAMGETRVTVEFSEVGGATEVVLTHDRFPAAEARDEHTKGWTSCLDRLDGLFA